MSNRSIYYFIFMILFFYSSGITSQRFIDHLTSEIFFSEKKHNTQKTSFENNNTVNFFGNSAASDGPTTIYSNSLVYDGSENKIIYEGDVFVIQTKNVMAHHKIWSLNQILPSFFFSTIPFDYENDTELEFKFLKLAKNICLEQRGCRLLVGNKLDIILSKDKKVHEIILTSKKSYTSKFYFLPFNKKKYEKKDLKDSTYVKGEKMTFNFVSNILKVKDKAFIDRKKNEFHGEEIMYNNIDGLVTVPNTGERATFILNDLENTEMRKF